VGYYKNISVHGYEFPVTIDGVIVNPRAHLQLQNRGNLDSSWENAVIAAASVFDHIYEAISEIHCAGLSIHDYEDAVYYVKRIDDVGHLVGAASIVRVWQADGWLKLPDDLDLFLSAVYSRYYKPAALPVAPTPDPGYVYLVQSPTGAYKIGRAKNPKDRVRTFGVKLPFEIELIHTIEAADYKVAERQLHERFAPKRVNGEWFNLTPEDVASIKSIERL
jgi:hypothetical protein